VADPVDPVRTTQNPPTGRTNTSYGESPDQATLIRKSDGTGGRLGWAVNVVGQVSFRVVSDFKGTRDMSAPRFS